MSVRNTLFCVLLGFGLASVSPIGAARVNVEVELAPPPVPVEVVPESRYGYVWVPGYWNWAGTNYVWVRGRWVHERPGYAWVPHRWVQRDGRWHREGGSWERGRHERWEHEHDRR